MTQTTGLCFYVLGSLRIERDGVAVHLPRRKVESLLAYLLLHPEKHARDHLATLLWGDSSDAQARHSLRTALATVRQQVSPTLLVTDREHVQLSRNVGVWVDLHQLLGLEAELEQVSNDQLQAQLALWQGDLLADFYDEWLTSEREHYRTRLLKLFLQVVQTLRARSEYGAAISVAQRILALDPANEHAHQHLMFCYVASGDRPAALRQYELCVRALQEDLDAPPLPETTALYEWIKESEGEGVAFAARITNLPIPLTSFVGRTRETAEVKRLLAQPSVATGQSGNDGRRPVRLLTLTGPGGSGKTRLAIQAATDLIDRFADGVWWVELVTLSDSGQVARALAKTLGVREVPDQPLNQTIANFVGDKQMLLVIDNCEHLIAASAQLTAELLAHCPNLQILTTSRESLNVAGETLWQAPALAAPDPKKLGLVDLLLQFESIKLFVERASAVQPGFALTPANAQAIAEICQHLDGIPLAIELAAARVKVLSVEQIAAYLRGALGARFALLTRGSRAAPLRQQTLRAAIDWSYDLLDDTERLLFRLVAIFRDGFTIETLEQVVGSGLPDTLPVIANSQRKTLNLLDVLTQLVDKSLVIVEQLGGQNRYCTLETLREYALERYPTPDDMDRARRRHAEFFLQMAERAAPELLGAQQQFWLTRLEMEHANLRAALDYLLAHADGELALRLATAITRFWDFRGYVSEGREWLHRALALRESATIRTLAKAMIAAGWLALRQGDYGQAQSYFEEGLARFEQAEEEIGIAEALQYLALVEMDHGNYPSAQHRLEQSLALARAHQDTAAIARGLKYLGALAWDQDRFTNARDYYLECLSLYQALGDQVNIASGHLNLGDAERMLDDLTAACADYEACLALARALEHKGLTGAALKSLGMVVFRQEAFTQARCYGEEALEIFRQLGDKTHVGFALSNLGHVARKLSDNSKALAYFCQNLQIMYEIDYKWPLFEALEDIAGLLSDVVQHLDAAARFWGAATRLRQETGIAVAANQQARHERVESGLRQQLGDAVFHALLAEGRNAPLAQCVAAALALSLAAEPQAVQHE